MFYRFNNFYDVSALNFSFPTFFFLNKDPFINLSPGSIIWKIVSSKLPFLGNRKQIQLSIRGLIDFR